MDCPDHTDSHRVTRTDATAALKLLEQMAASTPDPAHLPSEAQLELLLDRIEDAR